MVDVNNKQFELLFWKIFDSNGEDELHEIVKNDELLKDSKNWFPYGGKDKDDRSNFSTFENQQSNSAAALVEKITNSIDALLLKQCKKHEIDPKSSEAPKTMEMATSQFYDIPKGDIGEIPAERRKKLAKDNIQIIATGQKAAPDLMIWDNGEGQHPDDFRSTFLSLAQNNKTDIPFVQGKYNMGSTGAVVFCGEYRYQLVASKKDQQAFETDRQHSKNLFGWTLVRRHVLSDEEEQQYGSTWYEYFAINGDTIPRFETNALEIGLVEHKFETGSFIKLFSYELPYRARTAILTGLYRVLNQLLYKPALPIYLYERRTDFSDTKRENSVYGNHVRIHLDARENIETILSESFNMREMGEVTVQVAVFKKDIEERQYIGHKNLIYIQNGQVQGYEGQSFITQDLRFNFLKNSMLIVIDCTDIKKQYGQDLFMANRSNVREHPKSHKLKEEIIEALKHNQALRHLNNIRKQAILQGGDNQEVQKLIKSTLHKISSNVDLQKFLKSSMDLGSVFRSDRVPSTRQKNKTSKPLKLKRYPSIFKINLKEDKQGKKIKSIPLGGQGIIQFETDVINDYLSRSQDKGDFRLYIHQTNTKNNGDDSKDSNDKHQNTKPRKVEDYFDVHRSGPDEGSIKLTMKPRQDLKVGDEIGIKARLTSPDGDQESIFYVGLSSSKPKTPQKKVDNKPTKLDLPNLIKVTRDEQTKKWQQDNGNEWQEVQDWDEQHIIHIMPDAGKVVAIAINMSSWPLQKYLSKHSKHEKGVEAFKNQYMLKVYLHGLFLYSILESIKNSKSKEAMKHSRPNSHSRKDEYPDTAEQVATMFKSYIDVLMYVDINREMLDVLEQ